MKTFFIPIDFSEHSFVILKYALLIAGKEKAINCHIHNSYNDQIATPDPGISGGFDNESFLNIELIDELRNQSLRNMNEFISKSKKYLKDNGYGNITIEHSVEGGDPEWEILSVCREFKPDLIVMGTHGRGRKEFFEGSVAKKIMNSAKVPVIAVPENINELMTHFNIMYPANNKEKDFSKINLLFTIFKNIPFKIHVVHFCFEGDKDNNISHIEDLKAAFEKEIKANILNIKFIDAKSKDEILRSYVSENEINAIAFIAHKSNIFKSLFSHNISKNDFFELGLPMIALHE